MLLSIESKLDSNKEETLTRGTRGGTESCSEETIKETHSDWELSDKMNNNLVNGSYMHQPHVHIKQCMRK